MKIDEKILVELLTDDGHMGELKFLPEVNYDKRREGTIKILENIKTQNIVHIGCCGHFHNIEKQIKSNSHFHKLITEKFDKVIGFDINEKSVEYLKTFGVQDIYAYDFVKESNLIKKQIMDKKFGEEGYTILLPEVLEHICNPVSFLQDVTKHYGKSKSQIVISVPNAYGFGRVLDALFNNKEVINIDHKYMFTPTTLLKVMCMAEIVPEEVHFLDLYKYSKWLKKPMLGNTIVAVGRFK